MSTTTRRKPNGWIALATFPATTLITWTIWDDWAPAAILGIAVAVIAAFTFPEKRP